MSQSYTIKVSDANKCGNMLQIKKMQDHGKVKY